MLIGQLVNKTGLSKDTIRFYEKHGLISVARKQRRHNNYKEYSDEILGRLLTIKRLKNFGFTLNEIGELLDMIEVNDATCKNVEHKISGKVAMLDQKIKELIAVRTMLLAGVKACRNGCGATGADENCPILISSN